jgi:hypothetical protein
VSKTNRLLLALLLAMVAINAVLDVRLYLVKVERRAQFESICTDRGGVSSSVGDRFECRVNGVLAAEVCR